MLKRTPFYDYKYWDLQFYYKMHIVVQKSQWEIPLAYDTFIKRLKKMTLYDAIYRPRAFEGKKWKSKTPIQDRQRRLQKLKDENIPLVFFKDFPKARKKNRRNMMPNKKSLREKFISLFR